MRRRPAHCLPLVVAAVIVAVTVAACGSGAGARTSDGKIVVVAAENVWGDIASQIGGSRVQVTSIITDPDADPHQYETDPKSAAVISRAAFVIENGVGYDDFVDKLLAASPDKGREGLSMAKVVGVGGDNPNPHLWYDPSYVEAGARAIERQLATEDPAGAATYTANLTTFLAGERRVVAVIDRIRTGYAGARIAYTERVPGYLVQAAGLVMATPASFSQSIEDGNDPSPGDTAAFDADLTGRKVRVLLYNSQVTSPVTTRARELAAAAGVPVVGVGETLPPGKNFQTWQADQATALLSALGG